MSGDERYFDTSEGSDQLYDADPSSPDTIVVINGSRHEIAAGSNFTDTVKTFAQEAGMGKFRVFLNSTEITKPSQAPANIVEGSKIEIRPYDVAG